MAAFSCSSEHPQCPSPVFNQFIEQNEVPSCIPPCVSRILAHIHEPGVWVPQQTASPPLCKELLGTGCHWNIQGCRSPSVSLLPPALPWMRCRGSSTALARGARAGERILTGRFGEGELSSAKCSPPGLGEHQICGHSAAWPLCT